MISSRGVIVIISISNGIIHVFRTRLAGASPENDGEAREGNGCCLYYCCDYYYHRHVPAGGMMRWKPSLSSSFSIREFLRAYYLIEIRQAAPCRAIRGDSISVNSTFAPLLSQDRLQL